MMPSIARFRPDETILTVRPNSITLKPEVRKTIAPKSREAPWAILRTDPATPPNPQPLKPYKP